MLLIPAIDLKDGHCVRLKQGEMDAATVFSEDPGAMARHWIDQGARRLHLVDLNGAFAEYTVVQQSSLALKPQNISMELAASLPLVSLAAWQALVEIAKVQAGQKVLIHAGSGGVGMRRGSRLAQTRSLAGRGRI